MKRRMFWWILCGIGLVIGTVCATPFIQNRLFIWWFQSYSHTLWESKIDYRNLTIDNGSLLFTSLHLDSPSFELTADSCTVHYRLNLWQRELQVELLLNHPSITLSEQATSLVPWITRPK